MALRKNFQEGSKFYYAVIGYVGYVKNTQGFISVDHLLKVDLIIKDDKDPEFLQVENSLEYTIPEKRFIKTPVMNTVPDIDPESGILKKDEEGKDIMIEVENGFEEKEDESYQNPFDVAAMQPKGKDLAAVGYEWLLGNVEFFKDFENC